MKFTPPFKGLITAALMIAIILLIYYYRDSITANLQYLVYITYGLGIAWTILAYKSSPAFTGKFRDAFSQGFKCFIVVTLLMALFYGIFNYLHPEFATETAEAYKMQMTTEAKKLPSEIDTEVITFKKQYTLKLVSGAIFGYLIIGAAVTAAVSVFATRRN